jgi:hypothetical protein
MKGQILLAGCFALVMAALASAQTKITGSLKCEQPEPVYNIEVGDRPSHTVLLEKIACTYTQPWDIGGDKPKDGYSVATADATSTRIAASGTHVSTMESGDKAFVAFRDTAAVKDGKAEGAHGTWSYTGGTGKLKGIKGKGTYTTSINADGTSTVDVEGEYELPAAKASTKK